MVTAKAGLAVSKRDKFKCTYCCYDASVSFDAWYHGSIAIDHKTPRSGAGSDDTDNLCVACAACNGLKGNREFRSVDDTRLWLELYRELVSRVWYDRFVVGSDELVKLPLSEVERRFSEKTGYSPGRPRRKADMQLVGPMPDDGQEVV